MGGQDHTPPLHHTIPRKKLEPWPRNEWEEEAVVPMSTARRYFETAVLDGKLHAAGGESDEAGNATSNLVERYDLATKSWEAVAPMAAARYFHATAVLDGKLYAVGGDNDDDHYLSSVERYDPAVGAWEAVAPMAAAREAHAVAVLDGKLYVLAGTTRLWAGTTAAPSARSSGTTRRRTRGRLWRRWRRHGMLTPWPCSTASCTLWAGTTTASSAQSSGTTRRRVRGRRWLRLQRRGAFSQSRCSTASCTPLVG